MIYDEEFYRDQFEGSYRSAKHVVPLILDIIKPKKVVDIGCGVGTWLSVFEKYGIEILGIDGDYVDKDLMMIKEDKFLPMNLEEKIILHEKFDLVMTLEVIEHLQVSREKSFVRDLMDLGDVILFSGAVPGQGGKNHINERCLSYWKNLFEENHFVMLDCIRPLIWNCKEIEPWYKQNTVLFFNEKIIEEYKGKLNFKNKNNMIDLIHPEIFNKKTKLLEYPFYKKIAKRFY